VKSLIFVLIIPVLLLTPTIAMATNESSYLYGKQQGKLEWSNCTTTADDNGNIPDCLSGVHVCSANVDNQTACIDGYVQSWNHSCNPTQAHKLSIGCPTTFEKESQ
jgi:hypothetical protein